MMDVACGCCLLFEDLGQARLLFWCGQQALYCLLLGTYEGYSGTNSAGWD